MKILGHTFLRSNFKSGDPTRITAAADQVNTVANILKDVQGVNCRIVKNTTANGLGWLVVFDGTSDVTPPTGVVSPLARAASSMMCSSSSTSSVDKLDGFVADFTDTNTQILESTDEDDDASLDTIVAKVKGIYILSIGAYLYLGGTDASPLPSASASIYRNDDTGDIIAAVGAEFGNMAIKSGESANSQAHLYTYTVPVLLEVNTRLHVYIGVTGTGGSTVSNVQMSAVFYQPVA